MAAGMMSPAGLPRNLEAGRIWVNSENNRHLPAPFGGMKSSGIGRDGGDFELTDEEQAARPFQSLPWAAR